MTVDQNNSNESKAPVAPSENQPAPQQQNQGDGKQGSDKPAQQK
jgi:hypothetical protein